MRDLNLIIPGILNFNFKRIENVLKQMKPIIQIHIDQTRGTISDYDDFDLHEVP